MALTLENALRVKQRCVTDARKAATQSVFRTLFSHLAQIKRNPDLQWVALTGLSSADVVAADVPCRLYGLVATKPAASTTDSWLKGSDSTSAAGGSADIGFKLAGTGGGGQEIQPVFPDGLIFNTGLTFGAHTTVNGTTDSNIADAPVGYAVVGAL